jgi:hypothetical protein
VSVVEVKMVRSSEVVIFIFPLIIQGIVSC